MIKQFCSSSISPDFTQIELKNIFAEQQFLVRINNIHKAREGKKEGKLRDKNKIEGSNIEYGNIKKCNIDSDLRSKNLRLVISKKSDGNIEFNFENGNIGTNMGSNGVPRGVKRGHSIPYHPSAVTPPPPTRGPRLTLTETVLVTKYCRC
jgi:hypothetical protein